MNIDQLKSVASKSRGFASANQFLVQLPSLGKYDTRDLNILCTNVNMPGRQIMTQERIIGPKARKMPTGFASATSISSAPPCGGDRSPSHSLPALCGVWGRET